MSLTTENTILKALSGENPAEEATVNELINITLKYPAFGAAKYLLVKKMSAQGMEGFEKYAQNAALYFPDPFWFHFKLNEERLMQDETLVPKPDLTKNNKLAGPAKTETPPLLIAPPAATQNEQIPSAEATGQPSDSFVISHLQEEILSNYAPQGFQNGTGDLTAVEASNADELLADTKAETPATTGIPEEEALLDEAVVEATMAATLIEEQAANNIQPALQVEQPKKILTEEAALEKPDITLTEKAKQVGEYDTAQPKFVLDQTVEDNEDYGDEDEDANTEAFAQPLSNDRISNVLQEQAADFKKPVAENTPVPVETEPYHTIDYFASQGIKLTLEQQSQDHLSVKVKKFTDWLKQMKRITPQPTDLGIDEAAEHNVKNIAAGSIELNEVVTEAMAEVLVKQGMNEKAIDVYVKLSLLYPAKSAYFASQIEQLKRI